MSLCFRTRPNKFTSFANTRKQLTKIDRRLPKYIKSSPFLEEFLGIQCIESTTSNFKERVTNYSTVHSLCQTLLIDSVNSYGEWAKICNRKNNRNEEKVDGNTLCNSNRNKDIDNNVQWIQPIVHYQTLLKNNSKKFHLSHIDMQFERIMHDTTMFQPKKQQFLLTESKLDLQNTDENNSDRPSQDPSNNHLQIVYDKLKEDLPAMFIKPFNYTLYTNDVIFINNIRGVTTKGLFNYVKQIALVKIIGHLRFAYITLEILKITMHPEDGTVKVRWRIIGLNSMKVFFMFWRLRVAKINDQLKSRELWYDGFSTFYVNDDGKVYKHVVDKMMPDQDVCEKTKTPIAAKLALFTGFRGLDTCSWSELCLISPSQLPRIK